MRRELYLLKRLKHTEMVQKHGHHEKYRFWSITPKSLTLGHMFFNKSIISMYILVRFEPFSSLQAYSGMLLSRLAMATSNVRW